MTERSHTRQMIGSLLAALLLVVVTLVVVTARLGPIELDDDGGDRVEDVEVED